MKLRNTVGFLAVVAMLAGMTVWAQEPAKELKTDKEKLSYALGVQIGQQIAQMRNQLDVDLNVDLIRQAIQNVMEDGEMLLSDEEMMEVMSSFQQKMQQKMQAQQGAQQENMKKQGAENAEAGKKFLAENAQKEGVKVTDSGLQYKVIKEGEGGSPSADDTVKVHYRGTFINGEEFDSSYERGQPATFPLNGVIAGWTEGLQLMKEGGKMELYVPAELAYGQGRPGIPPNSVLVFEVELLEIVDK